MATMTTGRNPFQRCLPVSTFQVRPMIDLAMMTTQGTDLEAPHL
jgi:hypothetical protein